MQFGNPLVGVIHPIGWNRVYGEWRVTRGFGDMSVLSPVTGKPVAHTGLDIGNHRCGNPILAAAAGRVIEVGVRSWSLGAQIIRIRHVMPPGIWDWRTDYYHLGSIAVKLGDQVTEGAVIGTVNNTGHSFGCHLHFGTYIHRASGAWLAQNPWPLLKQNL